SARPASTVSPPVEPPTGLADGFGREEGALPRTRGFTPRASRTALTQMVPRLETARLGGARSGHLRLMTTAEQARVQRNRAVTLATSAKADIEVSKGSAKDSGTRQYDAP